jgi:outer membrane protein OmpA-like peptidoglycan-associated protein
VQNPRFSRGLSLSLLVVMLLALMAASCGAAEDLIDEQTGGTLDLTDVTIPDLNAPDFTVPDIVAPDIDVVIIEAPELPVIRFPDAITIEIPEITSPEVEVTETEDETIYTVSGQILFDFDRADLRPEALDVLAEVLAAIENRDYNGTIEVAGHTDSIGTAEYNQDLSVRRATGVALWFRQRVPAEQDIQAVGYGESQPIARNTLEDGSDDPVGRTQNRRVEIIVNRD